MYLQQDQLATSAAGQWESRLILIKSPPSFCEEAGGLGLEGWVMCNSKGPHFLRLAGRSPVAPTASLSLAARTSAAHAGQAVGQKQLPPGDSFTSLSLGCCGIFCTCLFASSPNTVFGRFFTIYSDAWLFIADWQVFGLGMKVGGLGR